MKFLLSIFNPTKYTEYLIEKEKIEANLKLEEMKYEEKMYMSGYRMEIISYYPTIEYRWTK